MDKFKKIIFDLDSTLVTIEGLDWLAQKKGKGQIVAELTKKSMDGTIPMEKIFDRKMELISPSYIDMVKLGKKYCRSLVKDAKKVISELIKKGGQVWILTGNFDPAVSILAKHLKIPKKRVICNKIYFDKNGKYIDYNRENPLAKNNGKKFLIKKFIGSKKGLVLVGDGSTDLEAKEAVDLFIAFGGVVKRKLIKQKADIYIEDKTLFPILKVLLND